jgi:hypothetical protein
VRARATCALAVGCLATLTCMPGKTATQLLTPQGAFQMFESEWGLAHGPLSASPEYQQPHALPDCAASPYRPGLRCQASSRCVIPGLDISIGCLHEVQLCSAVSFGCDWQNLRGGAWRNSRQWATHFQVPVSGLVPPSVLPASLAPGGQHEPRYILVPVETAVQGRDRLIAWRAAVHSGQPICVQGRCWAFRVMTDDERRPPDGREVIAACPVVSVRGTAVPVDWCTVVAVAMTDTVLVRAVVGSVLVRYVAGRPDLKIKLRGTTSALAGFAEVIGTALRSPPMNLAVQSATTEGGSISVYGIANYRPSPFLPGWREILTVHIQGLGGGPLGQDSDYTVLVSITAYINKQATRRSQDYRLPEQSQQDLYNERIGAALVRQLKGLVATIEPLR